MYPVVTRLQTFASACAVAVLHALDVPVMREGNVMLLPGGASLFVAEACSGITSLLSLMPVGVLLARFTQAADAGGAPLLVLSVVPAALFGNMVARDRDRGRGAAPRRGARARRVRSTSRRVCSPWRSRCCCVVAFGTAAARAPRAEPRARERLSA